jgi:hypothetical protein
MFYCLLQLILFTGDHRKKSVHKANYKRCKKAPGSSVLKASYWPRFGVRFCRYNHELIVNSTLLMYRLVALT